MKTDCADRQRGVITILLAMVLLMLITSVVVTAFSMSTTNLRAVGNVQARDGAVAAAQRLIEQSIGGGEFARQVTAPSGAEAQVSLSNDIGGAATYRVVLAPPECVAATAADDVTGSSVLLPGIALPGAWDTIWEFHATAEDPATGATVEVIQGLRVLLGDTRKKQHCPGP